MKRGAENRILEDLRARGLSGLALRDAFILGLGWRVIESSIFAHEGRHAIDAEGSPKWWRWLLNPGWKSEYQAKLSEVAFPPDPRLALTGGIIVNNIGTESPHGEANTRIMRGDGRVDEGASGRDCRSRSEQATATATRRVNRRPAPSGGARDGPDGQLRCARESSTTAAGRADGATSSLRTPASRSR